MFRRSFGLFLATILLFAPIGSALAQDATPTVFCAELDDSDCELLLASKEAMDALRSGSTTTEFRAEVIESGMAELPISEMDIDLYIESSFVIDPKLSDYLEQVEGMVQTDSMNDPDFATELSISVLQGIEIAHHTELNISTDLAALLSQELGQPIPAELAIGLRLIDGVLYVDLASLTGLTPDLGSLGGWLGIDLVELIRLAEDEQMANDIEMESARIALIALGLAMSGYSTQILGTEGAVEILDDLVQIRRMQDAVVDDEPVAVFNMTIDSAELISSPDSLNLMFILMQALERGVETMGLAQDSALNQLPDIPLPFEDYEEMGFILAFMVPTILLGVDFEVSQAIGLSEPYVYESELNLNWSMMESLARGDRVFNPPGSDGMNIHVSSAEAGDVNIHVSRVRQSRDFDKIDSIPVPDGALVLPINMLLQLVESP